MKLHPNAKNIAGHKFGRLTAIEPVRRSRSGNVIWRCSCECGGETEATQGNLKFGSVSSCGCWADESCLAFVAINTRHGHARHARRNGAWQSWRAMAKRCRDPNGPDWKHYGGRGITICERWEVYENFLADMGERPEGLSLDRIDFNGNYEPSNCRWADAKTQASNRRRAA